MEHSPPSVVIVLVDDDAEILECLTSVLAAKGTVRTARTVDDAGAMLSSLPADVHAVLVADVDMPPGTRWASINAVVEFARTLGCVRRVVRMSGDTMNADAPGDAFIAKPFTIESLVSEIGC